MELRGGRGQGKGRAVEGPGMECYDMVCPFPFVFALLLATCGAFIKNSFAHITHTYTHTSWLAGRHNGAYGQRQCLAKCGSSWGSTRSFHFFCSHQSPTPLSAPPLPPSLCRFWPSAAATCSCTFFEHLSGCGSHLPLSSLSLLSQRPLTSFQLSVLSLHVFNFLFWGLWNVFWPAFAQVSWWIGQNTVSPPNLLLHSVSMWSFKSKVQA